MKLTKRQQKLKHDHGTPLEFSRAVRRAENNLDITANEANAAIRRYHWDWTKSGIRRPVGAKVRVRFGKWISTDHLPAKPGWYLGWVGGQLSLSHAMVRWDGFRWSWEGRLTHWMPLPNPPQS